MVMQIPDRKIYPRQGCCGVHIKPLQCSSCSEQFGCHIVQGRALTASIKQVHVEFAAAFAHIQGLGYDVTDATQTAFDGDCGVWRTVVRDLDHRLGHLMVQVGPPCHLKCTVCVF